MLSALREHFSWHSDTGVVIAGVLQSAPTLNPLLPDEYIIIIIIIIVLSLIIEKDS